MFEQDPPPGWGDDNPTTEFDLRFYRCERVSWGNFERGPIHMILDFGTGFTEPESCDGERESLQRVMDTWWFSDQDVASYVRDVYGVEAYYSPIDVQVDETAAYDQTWTWGLEGQPQSTIRLVDPETPTEPAGQVTRIYWFKDGRVSAMDLEESYQVHPGFIEGGAFRPAVGRLEEPMSYAVAGDQNEFVARAVRYSSAELAADFFRFGDLLCEEPL